MSEKQKNRQSSLEHEENAMLSSVSAGKIVLPILIALGVVSYMFYSKWDPSALKNIEWSGKTLFFIILAVISVGFRHFFYMWRLRELSGNFFTWKKCFELILIWEFSSAVTPTSAGGAAVVLFAIPQEKLSTGKTAAVVIYTIIIDTIFHLSMIAIPFIFLGSMIFTPNQGPGLGDPAYWTAAFLFAFPLVMAWGAFLLVGVFFFPSSIKRFLFALCSNPLLKRFRKSALKLGDDVLHASEELRSKPWSFFIKTYLITAGAWLARFSVLVCLIYAFVDLSDVVNNPTNPIRGANEFIQTIFLYIRQAALYVIMEVSPSPGGAGLADDAFVKFTGDLLPVAKIAGFVVVIGQLWRLLTYYIFLFVGAVVVPNWIRGVIDRRREERKAKASEKSLN